MTKLKIIINCGPCEHFIGKCLESVRQQSFHNWEAYVTVDACGDDTFDRAAEASASDQRILVMRNSKRRYSLRNQIAAINRMAADPEDVIVSLDGDDWFSREDALRIIADTYERFDCWMTYGSWSSTGGPAGTGRWPAYPDGTTDFRHARWLATAVRTWKRWIWDRIDGDDLRDDNGEYFRIAEDRAIMLPLLDMCGTERAKHIATPIMEYNQSGAAGETLAPEALRNITILEGRSRYARLEKGDSR